jgi:hypothetical protein
MIHVAGDDKVQALERQRGHGQKKSAARDQPDDEVQNGQVNRPFVAKPCVRRERVFGGVPQGAEPAPATSIVCELAR